MPEETKAKMTEKASPDKSAEANSLTRAGFGVGGGGFGGSDRYEPTQAEKDEWDRVHKEREEANR
jgi:hypothetical protein